MGGGRFDRGSYETYASTRSYDSSGMRKSVREVFTQRGIHKDLDPRYITVRESCDSVDNPNSRPIILALDVTGSMGFIASEIAATQLGEVITDLIDKQTVADPHIMFMAVGDVITDSAPLQASQFEADIRIAQQLSQIYVEGCGGGNNCESYTLPWYFAAFHTRIDSFKKRGKKGILITFGDELPPSILAGNEIERVFGKRQQVGPIHDYKTKDLYNIVSEEWEVFHIIVEEGSYARRDKKGVYKAWYDVIGNRAIRMIDYTKLSTIVRAIIEVSEGKSPEDIIEADPENRKVLEAALYGMNQQ